MENRRRHGTTCPTHYSGLFFPSSPFKVVYSRPARSAGWIRKKNTGFHKAASRLKNASKPVKVLVYARGVNIFVQGLHSVWLADELMSSKNL